MKKRQQIAACGTGLCATIPQKVVDTFKINTKRFFTWEKARDELIGTYCQSETIVTTRIRMARNDRFLAEILHAYVSQYTLKPSKKGGPMAEFEWDENMLQIRIPL